MSSSTSNSLLNVHQLQQEQQQFSARALNKPPNYHETCQRKSSSSSANHYHSPASMQSPRRLANNTFTRGKHHEQQPTTIVGMLANNLQQTEVKPMKVHDQSSYKQQQSCIKPKKTTASHSYYPNNQPDDQLAQANGLQRKLVACFQVYFVAVITLALIYAIYHLTASKQNPINQQQAISQQQQQYLRQENSIESLLEAAGSRQSELEQKMALMQKYIELIASDLQDTKERLREREKCHCSRPCLHNSTERADGASWQHHCDTCSCQSGKVSCQPIKCPVPACDDAQQVPGQCCPVCLKKCKYNQTSLRHGQTFAPAESPAKECTCLDGLIKCSAKRKQAVAPNSLATTRSKQQQQSAKDAT